MSWNDGRLEPLITNAVADLNARSVLLDQEHQFRLLVGAVREYALYMLDPHGHIVSWNAGAYNIKGYREDEVIGRHFSLFYTEAERAAGLPARCLDAAAREGRFEAEAQRVRKDGSLFWANVMIEPIVCGSKLVGFVKITRDITKRRETEERLRAEVAERCAAEEEARAARQRLLDAINSIPDGFALFDSNDRLLLANQRYVELYRSLRYRIEPGESFETLIRARLCARDGIETGASEAEVAGHVDRYRHADGTPHVWSLGQKWLMSTAQRTLEGGVVVVETDITELKKSELAKDEFLAVVSHELRTPLTPIYGALSLIASGMLSDKPGRHDELVEAARHNCERLMLIVNDLLDITRINSGKCSIDIEHVDLVPALEAIIANKRIDGVKNQIRMTVSGDEAQISVKGDRRRIQQVFDNLLSNAIKFSQLDIDVCISRRHQFVCVSVADKGCGVPIAMREKIFTPFFQGDSSLARARGGLGLGLALSKAIVEAHEGRLSFQSTEGEGATFIFELPAADGLAHSFAG